MPSLIGSALNHWRALTFSAQAGRSGRQDFNDVWRHYRHVHVRGQGPGVHLYPAQGRGWWQQLFSTCLICKGLGCQGQRDASGRPLLVRLATIIDSSCCHPTRALVTVDSVVFLGITPGPTTVCLARPTGACIPTACLVRGVTVSLGVGLETYS